MRDELAEERPHRGRPGIGSLLVGELDAHVTRTVRTAELVQARLVDLKRREIVKQAAVAPPVDRGVHPLRSKAMVAGDANGMRWIHGETPVEGAADTRAVRPERAKNTATSANSAKATAALRSASRVPRR